jgi:hypothetical protein
MCYIQNNSEVSTDITNKNKPKSPQSSLSDMNFMCIVISKFFLTVAKHIANISERQVMFLTVSTIET